MKVAADFDRCMGNGVCEAVAPDYFSVGDDAVVVPPAGEIPAEDEGLVRDAVAGCPARALRTIESTDPAGG